MAVKVEGIELTISSDAAKASTAVNALAESLKSIREVAKGGLGLSSVVKNIEKLGAAVNNVRLAKLREMASSIEKINGGAGGAMGAVRNGARQAAEATENVRPANLVNAPEASGTATETGKPAEALDEVAGKADKANTALKESFYSFRRLGRESHKASTGGLAKVVAALKRIAFYRIVRSVIKAISAAFSEGVNNAYQYSKAIGGPLAKNMDALATSFLYLKNGLGAGLAPIINALTPVVTALADAVANLGNTIAGFIALLTGQSTYVKAIKNMVAYKDATEGAAKAQRQLLGFDELNVLTDKGGSGGTAEDYSRMFETVDTSTFVDNIKKSLAELPSVISGKIKDALDAATKAIRSVKWSELPSKIASGIKTAFESFDFAGVFKSLGSLIGTALAAVVEFGGSALGMVRDYFLTYINTELAGLDEDATVLERGMAFVHGIFSGILNALGDAVGWVGSNVVDPLISGFITGLEQSESPVLQSIGGWLGDAWDSVKSFYHEWIEPILTADSWEERFKGIDAALHQVNLWVRWKMATIWAEVKHKGKDIKREWDAWWDKLLQPIKDLFDKITATLDLIKGLQDTKIYQFGGFGSGNLGTGRNTPKLSANDKAAMVTPFASGGYPDTGSLFLAGEAGPELVSQVNGRTGVINNEQFSGIVAAAADSIINAIMASGQGVAEAAREGGNAYLDGTLISRKLYPLMQTESKRVGPSAVTIG